MLKRFLHILCSALILILTLSSCKNQNRFGRAKPRPNILFILTDDQAWNLLGNDERYDFLNTPHLDNLMEDGVVFNNSFVTTSLCSPSRACFLSGCYAHRNGVLINASNDPLPQAPNIGELLRKSGYNTAFIGKWHMDNHSNPRQGWDYWLSFKGQGQYLDPELNENGRVFREKGYMTDILTDYTVRWLNEERNGPFCLFLWHKALHAPFTPAPRDSTALSDAEILEYDNWYDTMLGKPEWIRRGLTYGVHNSAWHESEGKPVPDMVTPKPWDRKNPRWMNYLRTLLAVDSSLGRIRHELEKLEIYDQTALIFSSDNGFFLGSHQRGDKRLMYEESIRIPLIIRYPDVFQSGSREDGMVLNIDIAPTLLQLAGINPVKEMQRRSLIGLVDESNKTEWRKSFLYEYFQESYAPGLVTMIGVRDHRFKYIHYPDLANDIDELYDLEKDPGEMHNLILDPDYEQVLNRMKTELQELKIKIDYSNTG